MYSIELGKKIHDLNENQVESTRYDVKQIFVQSSEFNFLNFVKLIFIHNFEMIVRNWHPDQLISIISFGMNQADALK